MNTEKSFFSFDTNAFLTQFDAHTQESLFVLFHVINYLVSSNIDVEIQAHATKDNNELHYLYLQYGVANRMTCMKVAFDVRPNWEHPTWYERSEHYYNAKERVKMMQWYLTFDQFNAYVTSNNPQLEKGNEIR